MSNEQINRRVLESLSPDNLIIECLTTTEDRAICNDPNFWLLRLRGDYNLETQIDHDPKQLFYDLYHQRAQTFKLSQKQSVMTGYFYPEGEGLLFGIQRLLPPNQRGTLKFYNSQQKFLFSATYPFQELLPKTDERQIAEVKFSK